MKPGRVRERFAGRIAGVGSMSGVRVVVGRWDDSPWGPFADAMVEDATGRRVLLAPSAQVRDFVAATYSFDEHVLEPVSALDTPDGWQVTSPSLSLRMKFGRRTVLGVALGLVPGRIATAPAWCTLIDPIARALVRGVRTRGTAGNGRLEWYGATSVRTIDAACGFWHDDELGPLAAVDPPCHFGFSSTPARPCVTSVVTTIERAA